MDTQQRTIAKNCKDAAENNTMDFPQIVGKLIEAGFDSYIVDFRRQTATYYLPNDESVEFTTHETAVPVAAVLDGEALGAAIREAQNLVPGYTYKGFCAKAKAAGCAGYMVSFSGKRAVYFGRAGVTHVEYFPGSR
ncbi:MAG TPA: DUF1398 domain-containing protein [Acetobacteraceae bacterium]|jgi:uncharacterized protein YbcV (DUF1398 family)|nr:DUF1398 domain-containing protein [Acetobacteraceae bacterium]